MTQDDPFRNTAPVSGNARPACADVVTPAEIDAEDVVGHFATPADAGPSTEFGLECDVGDVDSNCREPMRLDECPVCGEQTARPTFVLRGLPMQLVTCIGCRTGRLFPRPGPEQIRGFYPPEYYGVTGSKFVPVVEWLVRVVGNRHARAMIRGLPKHARVLDVGCGRGVLLSAMADAGLKVHGFEISEEAAAGADPRARITVAPGLVDARFPAAHFDQVILWHVLEHLPNPRETLTEIHRILAPGGRLIVAVPNYGSLQARWSGAAWFHLDLPRHLFHFPVYALRRLLDDCGFECRSEHHFSLRQNPFGWAQSALNRFARFPRNSLYTLLKRSGGSDDRFTRGLKLRLRLAYLCGMPCGLVLSVLAALFRSGASVAIVATSRPTGPESGGRRSDLDQFADRNSQCFAAAVGRRVGGLSPDQNEQ